MRLEGQTVFDGVDVGDDVMPGTVVEVLVGHRDELEARGYKAHLNTRMHDSGKPEDLGTC